MAEPKAKFGVGQLVRHKLFEYRGVVFDADPVFNATEAWYENVARTCPPKDQPWYHVLVHGHAHTTYVAERNLEADSSGDPIVHPALEDLFAEFSDGRYIVARTVN